MKSSSIKLNFIYSLGYNMINVLAPFIITPYVARVLGAENLGIYSYSNSVAYYFVIFAMLGVANYGNRTIASVRDDKDKMTRTFWDIYYLQLVLSLVTTGTYLIYSLFISQNMIVSLVLTFYVVSAGLDITWFFYGIENFRFVLIRNFLIKLIDIIFVFLLVKKADDLFLYCLIMALGFLLANLFMWTNVRKYIYFCKPIPKNSLTHLKPNLVLFIPVIAISFYNFMDKIMLGRLSNMTQVGYYDNSEKIMAIPQTIVTALGTVMLPRMTNMMAKKESSGITDYLKKSLIFAACVSSVCTFGIITVADEFIEIYLGKDYAACVTLLYCLMPCLIFKAYANIFRMQYIIPQKKDNIYVYSVCLGAIINFVFNLLLIPHFQAIGACIGTIVAEIAVCVYQGFFVLRDQKIGRTILQGFVFQLIGVIMFFVTNAIVPIDSVALSFCVKVAVGAIIFVPLSILFLWFLRRNSQNEQ